MLHMSVQSYIDDKRTLFLVYFSSTAQPFSLYGLDERDIYETF